MDKGDRRLIEVLLIFIVIFSVILAFKIKSSQNYDKQLYDEIYSEYNELFDSQSTGDAENNSNSTNEETNSINKTKNIYLQKTEEGTLYRVIASIIIPKIEIRYPVISETTDEYLKIAPCKYWGGEPNQVGNLTIIGHNYKTTEFFSRISTLEIGDRVILDDKNGNSLVYTVYDKFDVANNDFSCTNPSTDGTIDLTLITCTNKNSKMHVVKCRAKENKK